MAYNKEHPQGLNLAVKEDYSSEWWCLLAKQRSANTNLFKGGGLIKKVHRKEQLVMNTETVQAALLFHKKVENRS